MLDVFVLVGGGGGMGNVLKRLIRASTDGFIDRVWRDGSVQRWYLGGKYSQGDSCLNIQRISME